MAWVDSHGVIYTATYDPWTGGIDWTDLTIGLPDLTTLGITGFQNGQFGISLAGWGQDLPPYGDDLPQANTVGSWYLPSGLVGVHEPNLQYLDGRAAAYAYSGPVAPPHEMFIA